MKMQVISNKKVLGYSLYDFANSAYVLIFNAYAFPIFFKEEVWKGYNNGDFIWGLCLSFSVILAIILSPIIGRYSDNTDRTKTLRSTIFINLAILLLLVLIPTSSKYLFSFLFVVANGLFIVSLSLYDSILPHISNKKERTSVSGFAWGVGYIGGILCLLLVLAAQKLFPELLRLPFLITIFFYGLFSLFALKSFPQNQSTGKDVTMNVLNINIPKLLLFILLAVWLVNEGIDTVIYFTSLFGRETLQLDTLTLGGLLILVQLIAFPATWFSGVLAKKRGVLWTINLSIVIWILIVIGTQFVNNIYHFAIISVLTGLVIGSTQSLLRSYFSFIIPKNESSFYFGFYTIFSRFATLIGPLIFGLLSNSFNQRIAMLSILVPLILGWVFLNNQKRVTS